MLRFSNIAACSIFYGNPHICQNKFTIVICLVNKIAANVIFAATLLFCLTFSQWQADKK
jgi:hypothetical protein